MSDKYKVKLLNLVDLDPVAKMVNVEVTESKTSWFGSDILTYEAGFIYNEGIWLGHDNIVITDMELCYRLQECLIAKLAESKLDKYISTL